MGRKQADFQLKYFGVPLEKSVAEQPDGSALVRGFFTSDERDVVGDTITRAATEKAIGLYRQWGNIRYMHLPRPVGRITRIGAADGLEWNEVEILVIDPQAKFEVQNGLLKALSVGILVDIETLEVDENGGWIINEYLLAEISLVDHPANYDARLTSVERTLKSLARTHGLEVLRKAVSELKEETVERDLNPEDLLPAIEGEQEPVVDVDETLETVAAEEAAPVEEVETDEPEAETQGAPLAEEPTEEAPAAETVPVAEVEDVPAEEEEEEAPEGLTAGIEAELLKVLLDEINTVLDKKVDALRVELKAPAEVHTASEQTGSEDEDVYVDALQARIDELEQENKSLAEKVAELSRPADRPGMVTETELPSEETEPVVEQTVSAEQPKDLRSAIHKYFQTRNQLRN